MKKLTEKISGSLFLIVIITFHLLNFTIINFIGLSDNIQNKTFAIFCLIPVLILLFYFAKSRIKRVYLNYKSFLLFYCVGYIYTTFISGTNEFNIANSNGICDGFEAYGIICFGLFVGVLFDLTILIMNILLVTKDAKS